MCEYIAGVAAAVATKKSALGNIFFCCCLSATSALFLLQAKRGAAQRTKEDVELATSVH